MRVIYDTGILKYFYCNFRYARLGSQSLLTDAISIYISLLRDLVFAVSINTIILLIIYFLVFRYPLVFQYVFLLRYYTASTSFSFTYTATFSRLVISQLFSQNTRWRAEL